MLLQFRKADKEYATEVVAKALLSNLQAGKRVLWLVAGGSNIAVAVAVMQRLQGYEAKLTITLTDERYGPVGHADSNYQQLVEAGFKPGDATLLPVLQDGLDLTATSTAFANQLTELFSNNDYCLGLLGMGADGHISGILPNSPACAADSTLAVGYQAQPFDRVTTTFSALQKLDTAYCVAYGPEKTAALQSLATQDLSLAEQPAQILKQIPDAYVYNDQIESEGSK